MKILFKSLMIVSTLLMMTGVSAFADSPSAPEASAPPVKAGEEARPLCNKVSQSTTPRRPNTVALEGKSGLSDSRAD